ncbi:hypothetical protein GF345_01035, partial [Candidatus Woesearchaeota archaeon]|nr:hypothetical protein [Candidatus Woesearchaeota archaeon]
MRRLPIAQALFILGAVLIAFMAIVNDPSITGFASLDHADVFAGRGTYAPGDMAHLFVVPSNADYSIEVYDPDGDLYAVSTDFPVEKIGTYTVNAVLTLENLSVDISTSFEVIASDSSDDNTSE